MRFSRPLKTFVLAALILVLPSHRANGRARSLLPHKARHRLAWRSGRLARPSQTGRCSWIAWTPISTSVYAVPARPAWKVELHTLDSDIICFVEGSATFVTGGAVEGRRARANEVSGTSIVNGDAHHVEHGDVIIVPNGTPHWFRDVSPSVTYLALKLRQTTPTPTSGPVKFWKASEAFAKGGVLFDGNMGPSIRVDAIRSDKPLGVELHTLDTDVGL